jgi:hypothetical protein
MNPVGGTVSRTDGKSSFPIASTLRIAIISVVASFGVVLCSLMIQWFVYYDWLHETGPLRIIGTCLASLLTFAFVFQWQMRLRDQQRRLLQRFETIARMNDRARNALQTIECVTYLSRPDATESVREAVDAIDEVLREVLSDVAAFQRPAPANAPERAKRQSA